MDGSATRVGTRRLAMLGGERAVPRDRRILPWPPVTEEDELAVARVLGSGRFTVASTNEEEITGLEREWAEQVGVEHCVAVSNGTVAISLALAAIGVEPGDEVVVPALSFMGSALGPLHLLAVPVFVDVDPVTYNIHPALLEAAITERTKAILVVHLHGLPADMDEIRAIAGRRGIPVIEDAAQAHGATYRGRAVGSIGAVNTFSLNVSKNLATCGEGGLVTTDDHALATRARLLRQFGEILGGTGRSYVSHLPGWNHKPNAIQAAFTRSRLRRLAAEAAARDDNVRTFLNRLAGLPGLRVPGAPDDRTHVWHILRFGIEPETLGVDAAMGGPLRSALMRALRAEGVPLSQYQTMPLPGQPVFAERRGFGGLPWRLPGVPERRYDIADYPATCHVIETTCTLQKAHLHPAAGPLLESYADAFHKVWESIDLVVAHAMAMPYRPSWEVAANLAEAEWARAFDEPVAAATVGRSRP